MQRLLVPLMAGLLVVLARPALSQDPWLVQFTDVVDGDTIAVHVPTLPDPLNRMLVRVAGIDAPEIRGHCQSEIDRAMAVRDHVRSIFVDGSTLQIVPIQWDKYGGRIIGQVRTPVGTDLAEHLVSLGLATYYTGGPRQSWCPQ